jgi:hypothetical protein
VFYRAVQVLYKEGNREVSLSSHQSAFGVSLRQSVSGISAELVFVNESSK